MDKVKLKEKKLVILKKQIVSTTCYQSIFPNFYT